MRRAHGWRGSAPNASRLPWRDRRAGPARGAISVAFALMMAGVLAFAGLALDLSQVYNRKQELQQLADAVALAAAQMLDGTAAGIDAAVLQAATIAGGYRYAYGQAIPWNSAALAFAASPDAAGADWKNAVDAKAGAAGLRYARVDTRQLDGAGTVTMPFAALLGDAYASAATAGLAVAGRSGIEVAPLAICAMNNTADTSRSNGLGDLEWVHYGFRYGVTYNLLNLNPALGAAAPEYFLVAPQAQSADTSDTVVGPYLCSGSMRRDSIVGATVPVRRPGAFTFSGQLNTRFDDFSAAAPCTARGTPPDTNVMAYTAPNWMAAAPAAPYAQPAATGAGKKLETVADRTTAAANAASYGALWAYGAAKRFAGAHGAIARSQWQYLYPVASGGAPAAIGTYPSVSPYLSPSAAQRQNPVNPGRQHRRLLAVPLLACPVAPGATANAQVLAVARFLLVAPASATVISAEFAGVTGEQALGGMVELYQ